MIRILRYDEVDEKEILYRGDAESAERIEAVVREVIDRIRREGDAALYEYTEKFDRHRPVSLEVTAAEIDEAISTVPAEMVALLEEAAARIEKFHRSQIRQSFVQAENQGEILGQRVIPLDRVGLYVPGGTASYPSSVLMNCIPAKLAGVPEIVMVTPAMDGKLNPIILAAARVAGVDRIFRIGGSQAIAALAYGTESVPRVDKIVGPGNAYVAEAKRRVFGQVAIDMIAGPSEILVLADGGADPRYVAADLLSQAEHDKMATAVLITDSGELAYAVQKELEVQLEVLPRRDIARVSVDTNGKIIIARNMEEAVDVSNLLAPEHLEICVDNPFDYLGRVRHAGSVFLGRYCPEALGDYFAGPNHTLPTSGTARFSSPLSVDDFVKKMQYTYFTREALSRVADQVDAFATAEGLGAHARSVTIRFDQKNN